MFPRVDQGWVQFAPFPEHTQDPEILLTRPYTRVSTRTWEKQDGLVQHNIDLPHWRCIDNAECAGVAKNKLDGCGAWTHDHVVLWGLWSIA